MLQTTHPFKNVDRAKQLINFQGLDYGRNNRPTDVDALFELRDKLYVIVEAKYRGNQMPFGQKLSLTRLVDDLTLVKPTLLIIATHTTPADQMVDLAAADVNEIRWHKKWFIPPEPMTVRQMVDKFIALVMK